MRVINKSKNQMPNYATDGASGLDIRCNLETVECSVLLPNGKRVLPIQPMQRIMIDTGLHFEVPRGYEGQLRIRSGISTKYGISLINGVGTIDSDYRGEVRVPVINLSDKVYILEDGERIAQLIIAPYLKEVVVGVDVLSDTNRGDGGFGSTGKK